MDPASSMPTTTHDPSAPRALARIFLRSSRTRLVHDIGLALYDVALASVVTGFQSDPKYFCPAHADGNGDGRHSHRAGLLAFGHAFRRPFSSSRAHYVFAS